MSRRTPPSLQYQAMQSLLSNQALAISALEDLPVLLFPSLFMEVYARAHTEMLKALVQAWPFSCLPLGDLEVSPNLETLNAVLERLTLLLAKKEHPSRWKLQFLDLQNDHPNIWIEGYPSMAQISYPDVLTDRPTENCGSMMTEEQPLILLMDLTIKHGTQDALQGHLLQWVRERRERVQLCSRNLLILSDSISEIQKALRVVRLDSIQELKVNKFWHRETMKNIVPYLSQMKNLRILQFSRMRVNVTCRHKNFSYSCKYAVHLGQLQHLQELYVHKVFFLYGQLPTILRNLTLLKTLSLSSCPLKEADLWFLSQWPCSRQLKHLRLRSLPLDNFSPEPLRVLLKHAACTLETLALEDCAITDPQLLGILPALSLCSQLSFFSFYGNHISISVLQSLLSHMARLDCLRQGIYPAPLECYPRHERWVGDFEPERFAQVQAQLEQSLRDMGTTQKVQICINFCHHYKYWTFYNLGPDGYWVVTVENIPGLSALPL
ncbi:PRAME family member 12-like [Dipodomys spectabilis]|uniref:PRAME family member 12-like n=1 Tax=Dipodomys spectabilis TaxID=105255 RepID=UPI001C53B0E7|nr:PRAME family member 12-like [Dipodomys spectabilis]